MNNKFLMYMLTGNIMYLFLPAKMVLMMSLFGGGDLFSKGNGPNASLLGSGSSSTTSNSGLLAMAMMGGMGGSGHKYRRTRYNRPIIVRNYRR